MIPVNAFKPRIKTAKSTEDCQVKPKETNYRKTKERTYKNLYSISLLLLNAENSTMKYSVQMKIQRLFHRWNMTGK
jgi:hypothetical protein